MLKKSNYNIFIPIDNNSTIVFNSFSGAVGIFDKNTMDRYETNSFDDAEFTLLKEKGIYIDADFDEKQKMFLDRQNSCTSKNDKFIRLWTTTACNADCFYCFERGMPVQHMSKETADDVISYIINHYEGEKKIIFEWFGGEPLLNTNVIDYFFDNLTSFCESHSCKIESEFITNGSLITEEIADKMKNKWHTFNVQITLDGNEDEYNRTKAYKSDQYNFKTVIAGIKLLLNKGLYVSVRMNYNRDNYESLSSLIDYLATIKEGHMSCYVYPLWDALGDENDGFKSTAYADENLIKLFDKLVDTGLANIKLIGRLNYKNGVCKSCNTQSVAVFPNGTIGKCSETFKQRLGNVKDGIRDKTLFDFWTSPEVSEECNLCKLLPLCQGGCKSSHFTAMPKCYPYKEILPEMIKWYVNKISQSKRAVGGDLNGCV